MFKIHRIDMLLGIHSCIYLFINQWLNTIVNKSTHAMCNCLTKVMYLICLYFMHVKIKLNFIQVNYNEIISEHVNVSWWYKGNLSTLTFYLLTKNQLHWFIWWACEPVLLTQVYYFHSCLIAGYCLIDASVGNFVYKSKHHLKDRYTGGL